MQFLTWEKRFQLGVPEMDEQHAQLVVLLNELHDLMNREADRVDMKSLMGRIRYHAADHFRTEEDLMVRYGYAGLEVHRGIHQELLKQVDLLEQRFGRGGSKFTLEIMCFIRAWLKDHLQGEDKTLAEFLRRTRG